ncbi:MAG: hypothetical protein ACFFG0_42460, partial [Candidatus Thorarchaeota archaeon]
DFSNKDDKPCSSLIAKFYKSIEQLMDSVSEKISPDTYLKELLDYFSASTGLIDFPFESFKKMLEEVGLLFPDSLTYDNVIDRIASIDEKRTSEISAGHTFLKRAGQKFISKLYKESVIYFGKSVLKLAKEESDDGRFLALKGLGHAFHEMDLLWASNNCFISAGSIAFKSWYEKGVIDKRVYDCVKNLAKNEQIIGRIPNFLTWHELFNVISTQVEQGEEYENIPIFDLLDACLAVRLLNTNSQKNSSYTYLPDILESQNLWLSQNASLFNLGYFDLIINDYKKIGINNENELAKHFELIANQPFRKQMLYDTELLSESEVKFISKILGCNFIFSFEQDIELLLAAETFAAFFESFLATSLKDVFPNTESIKFKLIKKTEENLFQFETLDSSSEYLIRINKFSFSREQHNKLWIRMMELISHILTSNFFIKETQKLLDKLFKNEEINERLTFIYEHRNFTINVLGNDPKLFFNKWINAESIKEYPLKREKPLMYHFENKEHSANFNPKLDLSEVGHSHRKVSSIIDGRQWDEAKWNGFGFFLDHNGLNIFIGFANGNAGKKIFQGWINRFGNVDENENIKITIIKGVDRFNPHWYRVHIGADIQKEQLKSGDIIISAFRLHKIEAKSPENLNNLISAFKNYKTFRFCPAELTLNVNKIHPYDEYSIVKKEITIRNAWEIGIHDIENIAIKPGDNPIIPENVNNAPVLEVLRQRKHDS